MNIISIKIMKILLEILIKNQNMEDNIIIFALATLVNISNRNLLKFENVEENKKDNKKNEKKDNNYSSSFSEEENEVNDGNEANKKDKEKSEDNKDIENDNINIINTDSNQPLNKNDDTPHKKKNYIFVR